MSRFDNGNMYTYCPYYEPNKISVLDSRNLRMVHTMIGVDTTAKIPAITDKVTGHETTGSESADYILKPALFLSKMIGVFPLSGAYEPSTNWINRYWRRIIFDWLIPIGSIIWLGFIGFVVMKVLASSAPLLTRRGVDYYSVLVTNLMNVMLSWLPATAAFFRNDRMAEFLKTFSRVDNMLAERKSSARLLIFTVYAFMLSLQMCKTYYWMFLIGKIDAPDFISDTTNTWGVFTPFLPTLFFMGSFIMAVGEIQTQVAYFAIVYTMGVGFRTIKSKLKKLRRNSITWIHNYETKLSNATDVLQQLKELRLQHVFLVEMGRRLDRLFSPVLLVMFTFQAFITSVIFFQMINVKNHGSWSYAFGVFFYGLSPFMAMMIVCTFTDRTIKAGNSIASFVFSTDLSTSPACRQQINLYALQLNVHQVQFTASGFFPINHSLAGTIIGITLTYSIVMLQLRGDEE